MVSRRSRRIKLRCSGRFYFTGSLGLNMAAALTSGAHQPSWGGGMTEVPSASPIYLSLGGRFIKQKKPPSWGGKKSIEEERKKQGRLFWQGSQI